VWNDRDALHKHAKGLGIPLGPQIKLDTLQAKVSAFFAQPKE